MRETFSWIRADRARISLTVMRALVRMGSIRLPAQKSRNVELVLFWVRRGLPAKGIERLVRWTLGVLGHRGHGSAGSSRNGRPRCS